MQMKQSRCLLLSLIIVITILTGCASSNTISTTDNSYTIGVVTKAKSGEYWMSYISGVNKAAVDYGVNIILLSPKAETQADVQQKMITDMLARDINAIAISPIDSYDTSYFAQAEQRNIPIYATDSDYFAVEVPYIGYDNYKMGTDLAKKMVEYIGVEGNVGIISGSLNQSGHKDRVMGFSDFLETSTEVGISFIVDGYSNLLLSETELDNLLTQYTEVEGIFVTNAVAALGLSDYLEKRDIEITICAIDAQQDAYEAVREGRIMALANHSGYDNGYNTIQRIAEDLNGKEEAGDNIFQAEILTSDNIEQYDFEDQ